MISEEFKAALDALMDQKHVYRDNGWQRNTVFRIDDYSRRVTDECNRQYVFTYEDMQSKDWRICE